MCRRAPTAGYGEGSIAAPGLRGEPGLSAPGELAGLSAKYHRAGAKRSGGLGVAPQANTVSFRELRTAASTV